MLTPKLVPLIKIHSYTGVEALFKSPGYNVKIFAKLYLSELISPALLATAGYVEERDERAAK